MTWWGAVRAGWVELYTYRVLIASLVGRQLATRYRRSVLGVLWTFLNPVLLLGVYSLVFAFYLRVRVPHYPAFVFSGLLPWLWFASSLGEGVNAIVGGGGLVTRVQFPPQVLPAVTVLANLSNFVLSLPVLAIFLAANGVLPSPRWLLFPLVVAIQLVFTLGVVFLVSALNVHYRDVQHLVANAIMLLFFLTPVLYPASQVPEMVRRWLWLNPLSGMIQCYQAIFLGDAAGSGPPVRALAWSAAAAVLVMIAGTFTMERMRDSFAEDL